MALFDRLCARTSFTTYRAR